MPDEEVVSQLRRVCSSPQLESFSGVVRVSSQGAPLFTHSAGLADRANGRQNAETTRFAIASGTKGFTALAIARLVDTGRLAFNASVAELLGGRLQHLDPSVTVHHLLTHTSGFYDYYDEEEHPDSDDFHVDIPWCELETPSDYLPLMHDRPMVGQPGRAFVYNNGGFVLLGAIVEAVTGELYRQYVEREILARAGMTRSGFFAFNQLPPDTANGYIDLDDGGWKTNIYNVPIRGGGDGGMYTTADDLDRFWIALAEGSLLSEPTREQVLSPHALINDHLSYGYGFYLNANRREIRLVGGDAGVGFDSRYVRDTGLGVTILSNKTEGQAAVRREIEGIVAAAS